jgi:hypothetical protein
MAAEVILKFVDEMGQPIPEGRDKDKLKKRWKKLLDWIGILVGTYEIIVTLGGMGGSGGGFRVKKVTITEVPSIKTRM